MALIKQYHKDTDTTYVYESESYWDPEKKQSRSRRKVVGKIDPETGEMVPTGKRGKKKRDASAQAEGTDGEVARLSSLHEQALGTIARKDEAISSLKADIATLKAEAARLKEENRILARALGKIKDISGNLPL